MSTVIGNPCCARSPVPSVVLPVLCQCAVDIAGVVGRINQDVMFCQRSSVGTEVTRLLPSPASSESENWHPVRGLSGRGLSERVSVRGPRRGGELLAFRMRLRRKASGESEKSAETLR